MHFDINLSPQITARLTEAAKARGIDPTKLLEILVVESLPQVVSAPTYNQTPVIGAQSAMAIETLNRWIAEEATDDPDEIRKADEEVAELKRSLNANRTATGERLTFS